MNQRNVPPKTIKHIFTDLDLYYVYKEYVYLTTLNDDDPNGVFYRRALEGKNSASSVLVVTNVQL